MKFALLFGFFAALVACTLKTETSGPAFSTGGNDAEEILVGAMLKQYYQDMTDRDWSQYRSHFWENATLTTEWQKPGDTVSRVHVITIDEFIREAPNGPGSAPVFEERMTGSKVEIRGNLATVWAKYEAKFGQPDHLEQWSGLDVFSLMKHEGQWKIVSLVFEAEK